MIQLKLYKFLFVSLVRFCAFLNDSRFLRHLLTLNVFDIETIVRHFSLRVKVASQGQGRYNKETCEKEEELENFFRSTKCRTTGR